MKTFFSATVLFAASVACAAGEPEELPAGPAIEESADTPAARISYFGGGPQIAAIVVRKKIDGVWVERKYYVQPADLRQRHSGEIGKVEKVKDPATGESAEVDFRSGCTLLVIRKERFKFTRLERDTSLPWPPANKTGIRRVRAERDRMRIHFLDRHGMLRRRWVAEGRDEAKPFPTGR